VSGAGAVEVVALPDAPRRDGIVDVDLLVRALWPVDLLESADRSGWTSLVPHATTLARLRDDGGRTRLSDRTGRTTDLGPDPAAALDAVCARHGLDPLAAAPAHVPMPFRGGLVGALAYELGARLAPGPVPLPPAGTLAVPDVDLRLTGVVVAVPRERDRAVLVIDRGLEPEDPGAIVRRVAARLRAVGRDGPAPRAGDDEPADPAAGIVLTSLPHAAHVAAVEAVLALVAAGDAYQVNIAQRLRAPWPGDLTTLYRRLRAASPASHAALLPDLGLASVSPERFLRVRSGVVVTDPIKGTRPRADDPILDAALADDLATAAKDRAENVMVVDLERNDLGRVCEPGSVTVPSLLELRALPTVWHLVSSVTGRLRAGTGYGALLRATFPSGSVTGAPRLAAMRTIGRLEPVRRGWYCGAVGFLGAGDAELSVAIRTATLHADGTATYGAGGGIVADSDPAAEVAESLDKAVPFLRAVGATGAVRPDLPGHHRAVADDGATAPGRP
jgi:para-aminobenzoate synthetase component 1